ncbi:hypothetical protein ACI3LY_005435 [Candidozyma auris]|uniref:AB hydrolase-1 domain-containing protein n=1 Tax=Candidozyma auris TaxID=498019 RepID=A0A8F2W3N8_CANAR|nr:hypothetical protein CA7LBN_004001 [[Candida] auris]
MASLISHSVATMGDPNVKSDGKTPTSIELTKSVKDWWNCSRNLKRPTSGLSNAKFVEARNRLVQLEYNLFRAILSSDVSIVPPGEAEPDNGVKDITARFVDTTLEEDSSVYIHEFEITNKTDLSLPKRDIVIIHGYMAALGYFIKNFEALAKSYGNLTIHAIDMPGFGNSARPRFPPELLKTPKNATQAQQVSQVLGAEAWFIDKFEGWRKVRNLEHFDLVAHSMGAYLGSCYIMKYNCQGSSPIIKNFVVVSPMGTESSSVSLINHKSHQRNFHEDGGDPLEEIFANMPVDESHTPELQRLWEKLGEPKFPKNKILQTMWEWSVSPFQILQIFGPVYSKVLSYWSFQRFKNLKSNSEASDAPVSVDLINKLHEYSYSVFNQYQGSGELAITKLINHNILARLPLCDRGFLELINKIGMRTLWLYGDKDWMNMQGGKYCVEKLKALGHEDAELTIVEDAGHHLYLDNPDEFNEIVIDFLQLEKDI